MDGIVAKRTLKKSYYTEVDIPYTKINNKEKKGKNYKSKIKERIIFKLAIQTITVIAIILFLIAIKVLDIKVVKRSEIIGSLKKEWNKNYNINDIKKYSNQFLNKIYVFINPVVPDKIEKIIRNGIIKINYVSNEDKKNEDINSKEKIDNKEVEIYEEINNNKSEDKEINNMSQNIGASVEQENDVITASSSLSYQDEIVSSIKETGISFIKPVSGNITSNFGAREEIFKGVDSYHTGTDIGAKSGTKVISSINGTVTVATYNQYNGNYVEVTNGDVVTKYLHLSKISVKKGTSIKAGTKIGEVGSTGLSTGPHLHFEVVYKGTKIDPRLVVNL